MKIAISSTGKNLNDQVAETFGRCPYFIFAEIKEGTIISTEEKINETENQASGAGIAAAQLMADNKIETVIAKNVGPKALEALNQFGIKVYTGEGTVKEAINNFIAKK